MLGAHEFLLNDRSHRLANMLYNLLLLFLFVHRTWMLTLLLKMQHTLVVGMGEISLELTKKFYLLASFYSARMHYTS